MRERLTWLRWVFLGVAVIDLAVFMVAQRQSVDVSYGQSPSGKDKVVEGAAGELTDQNIPSTAEVRDLVDKHPVVRLPGAIASWDTRRVQAAAGDHDLRHQRFRRRAAGAQRRSHRMA